MTHPPLYRQVLHQAWHLAWRHKILWAFGLFAAALGTGGALEVLARTFNLVLNPLPWGQYQPWFWHGRFDLITGLWSIALFLLLLGLAVFLLFIIINSFSNLIIIADQFRNNKKPDLKKSWQKATKKFWPVLGAVAFFKLLIVFFSALSIVPLWLVLINQAGPWLLIFYPLLFLISVVMVLISSFLMIYTANFILLEDFAWGEAIEGAGKIFIKHWLVNLEMALLIFLINLLAGLILLIGLSIIAVPAVLVFLFAYAINLPPLGAVAVFLGLLLATLLILWLASILGAFHYSAWTLLWRRMHQGTAVSKLIRLTKRVLNK